MHQTDHYNDSQSVTSIGEDAFLYCTGLTAITVDTNNLFYSSVNGVLFDKSQSTLVACPDGMIGNYTVSGTVTNIGNAFTYCRSLTSITIGNAVTSIGVYAFGSCGS